MLHPISLVAIMVLLGSTLAQSAGTPRVHFLDVHSAPIGAHITIGGDGLGAEGQILFNGVPAEEIPLWTQTRITVRVPQGATAGPVTVSTGSGTTASETFTPRPGRMFYIAPDGSDADPGSLGAPWRTIAHAKAQLRPGDVLYLRAGSYSGNESGVAFYFRSSQSGLAGNPITFRSMPGERVVLDGGQASGSNLWVEASHLVFSGLVITGAGSQGYAVFGDHNRLVGSEIYENRPTASSGSGVNIDSGTAGNAVLGCRVHHNGVSQYDHGFYLKGNQMQIAYNDVYENSGFGLQLYQGQGLPIQGATIVGNRFHHNGIAGLTANLGSTGARIINNIIYSNVHQGLTIDGDAADTLVLNNTFFHNGTITQKPQIHIVTGTGTVLANNIVWSDSGWLVRVDQTSGWVFDYNLYWPESARFHHVGSSMLFDSWQTTSAVDAHSSVAHPTLVDTANGDFHLQQGSVAIDAGDELLGRSGDILVDYEGDPRGGAWDIGADEATAPSGSTKPSDVVNLRRTDLW